jgi:hypothetical protein
MRVWRRTPRTRKLAARHTANTTATVRRPPRKAAEQAATTIITPCPESRSRMTACTDGRDLAREAFPPALRTDATRACRQARETSPSTPPGRIWFKKDAR